MAKKQQATPREPRPSPPKEVARREEREALRALIKRRAPALKELAKH